MALKFKANQRIPSIHQRDDEDLGFCLNLAHLGTHVLYLTKKPVYKNGFVLGQWVDSIP